ncbi:MULTISPECIES: FadR/GntR family transcriptional regulator [Streptomyces]|uniref:FCD domain-containing protein n=1 Tax=Streptomyces cyaneofuscatus TaxID=66883 RepID=A0ABZ1EPY8_9ACTN|nr:FCD domain-containing protein [Streptomyces cyaneofuscatus]WSB06176.1 FCD domain-containing protein [Streptomyces cyaneofuscatus]WSD50289.1 FCD domain-containing protein [Streptomyces cyaneofuscatus]WTA93788.1 FCD domain-containing protein [Streptomyces cyaneofuscatus]
MVTRRRTDDTRPEAVDAAPEAAREESAGGEPAGGESAESGSAPPVSVLRPVRAGNGFEETLEQVLQLLRLGLVPPGDRLPAERELAQHLGVSRVTLREVLKVLQDQGMVESRRGRYGGTFVLPRTSAADGSDELRRRVAAVDVEDTLRFREVLETGAAGLCADGLVDGGAARLRAALEATQGARLEDYRRQDTLLHLTLAELSGSRSLAERYASVRATLNELLDCIPLLVRNLEHSQQQHAAVVEAVLDRDAEAAREMMREHCAGTAALLRGFLV